MTFLNCEKLQILNDLQRLDVVFGETHARNMLYDTFDVFTGDDSIEVDLDVFYVNTLLVCLRLCSAMFGYSAFREALIQHIVDEVDNISELY